MKNIRVILLGGIVACSLNQAIGQSTAETALFFSRVSNGGSARVMGMGGANISLGGDFTSASANPAGLGMFNRSEFTFSPSYSNTTNHTTYWGNKLNESRTNLSIPSFSLAFQNPKHSTGWISSTFAITLTRMNDFHSTMTYEGVNDNNSIADYFAYDSYDLDPDDLDEDYASLNGLAYQNYLIEAIYNNQNQFTGDYAAGFNVSDGNENAVPTSTQREVRGTTGAQNQWTASYAANIDDRFFLGASIHLRSIRFESKSEYTESGYSFTNAEPGFNPLRSVFLEEKLKITGSGFSATIGAIMRPVDGVQVGIAYNTPTGYTMTDVYTGRIATDWNNYDYYGDGSTILNGDNISTDDLLSDYKLKTPGRLSVGATYFFGKNGFISGDVEFLNYVGAKYTSKTEGISYDGDNAQIKSLYRSGVNARVGGEYRLKDYRFRAGYNYMSDPLSENQDGVSRAINRISLGAGIRKEGYSVDVALVRSVGKNLYKPYSLPGNFSPVVDITSNTTIFMLTVGLPFR